MTSLVIAQAAAESGWGTSQLCTKANNLFGMTSVLAPNSKESYTYKVGNRTVVMRRYPNLLKSIEHYFFVIAIAKSYENFREKRWQGCHLNKLIAELTSYSEQKSYYGNFLRGIISQNELKRYDIYQIDKSVLKQIKKNTKPVHFLGNVIFHPPVFSAFITK
jgi:Bax protein